LTISAMHSGVAGKLRQAAGAAGAIGRTTGAGPGEDRKMGADHKALISKNRMVGGRGLEPRTSCL